MSGFRARLWALVRKETRQMLRERSSLAVGLLLPAALILGLFAWLLTLHEAASGRIYAAYGGVYIAASLGWMWAVEGARPDR